MASFIALLRAVNVGGTGKLPMSDLKSMCEAAGFEAVRTFIASGNVVFKSRFSEAKVKAALEAKLLDYAGKPVGVVVRTANEMAEVAARNPFADAPGNRVAAIFLNDVLTTDALRGLVGQAEDEQVRLGQREIYVCYGSGMGNSRLRIPAAKEGTARNMNTVSKLAAMAAELP